MENQITQKIASTDEFGQTVVPARNDGYKVVTVILSNGESEIKKPFHCCGCGRISFEHYGAVRAIILGEMREILHPIDVMCSRCKIIYRIN